MIMWMSELSRVDEGINENCLRSQAHVEFSHNNFFHTLMGMLGVKDEHYNAALGIIAPRKRHIGHLITAR